MKLLLTILTVFGLVQITGCSSAPKSAITATANPTEEIANLQFEIQTGYTNHLDVIAADDFKSAQDKIADANEAIKDGDKQAAVIAEISKAKGYLERAKKTAAGRSEKLRGVLEARMAAINAGAKKSPKETQLLGELDSKLRSEANDLGDIKPEKFSKLQQEYLALQIKSIQATHLGKARALIANSIERKAKKRAPNTLAAAQKDMANAENMISSNANSLGAARDSVQKANTSAQFLDAVMVTVVRDNQVLPESAAVDIATKNFKIKDLNADLNDAQGELNVAHSTADKQSAIIKKQGGTVDLNNRIKSISTMFDKNDAEVYRQEDKVLIRLKGMKFNTASSGLPQTSLALLGKVKEAMETLGASEVVVEGHTDSTGAADKNKELSQKRAETVAEYFKTSGMENAEIQAVGYGFDKPISSNKNKTGREQNRRVDVIITPSRAGTSKTTSAL